MPLRPNPRTRMRRWLAAALVLAAGAGTAGAAPAVAPAAAPPRAPAALAVRDPYYGVALFDFFQEHYFSSLADLMVAQHFGRLEHQRDEAEVLRGGLYLSYGLHREAAVIFTRLIDAGVAPPVRDRAWYYLAKIRFQRGMPVEAEEALGHIQAPLPRALEEDRALLKANLLMVRGDYPRAAVLLKPLADAEGAAPYLRYNLGVALVRSGTVARGSELLDELGVEPAESEELRSLRDRANVALGFAALQDKDPERARVYLARVRLSGMEANKALLAYGWASDAQQQARAALVPWSELAARDISDPAVQEAQLAVPYALAELGADALALEAYGKAVAAYDRENTNLDETIAAIRAGRFLDGLLERNPGDEMGWFWKIGQLPELPHPAHLAAVLAQHEFQEGFKNYRDLQFLARNLRDWTGRLDITDDMLANRRQRYAQRLPQVRMDERKVDLGRLDARRSALAADLRAAEDWGDGRVFADARERALAERLERVRASLERLRTDPVLAPEEQAAARERYRRVAGALGWELAQGFAVRLWEAKKSLQRLDAALAQAHASDAALAAAQRSEPGHFDNFAARIVVLRQRIAALQPLIAALGAEQRQALEQMAVDELERQRERLVAYSNQARFAIAEIYDRASLSRDAAHAPPK